VLSRSACGSGTGPPSACPLGLWHHPDDGIDLWRSPVTPVVEPNEARFRIAAVHARPRDRWRGLNWWSSAAAAPLVEEFNDNILIRAFGVLGSIGSAAFIIAAIAAGVTSTAKPAHPSLSRACSDYRGS
jgi:hypothetical protein